MFNKNFYPTPPEVIERMLKPYFYDYPEERTLSKYNGMLNLPKMVLDPSAGKGDIIDYIREKEKLSYGGRSSTELYAIEINPELNSILQNKECIVLAEDFLSYESDLMFDLIIMNPPFDQGAKHLLKAWEIMKNGDIVCLLNAETYYNPYTKERQLLKSIIDQYGAVEDFGKCFKKGERKTDVNGICVRLKKKTELDFKFDPNVFDEFKEEKLEFPEDLKNNQVAVRDVLKAFERQKKCSIESFINLMQAINRFEYFTKEFYKGELSRDECLSMATIGRYNDFVKRLTVGCWNRVLSQSKFTTYLTTKVKQNFLNKFTKQSKVAFTKENMVKMFETLWENQGQILEQGIGDVFDHFTAYHKENRVHIEGWSTNDAWRVNKKVVLPNYIGIGYKEFEINYYKSDKVDDIDRAMAYIMGVKLGQIKTLSSALKERFAEYGPAQSGALTGNQGESEYFKFKWYKKGTLHIEFKDRYLWEQFNYRAAQLKGFPLPEKTKHPKQKKANKKPTTTKKTTTINKIVPAPAPTQVPKPSTPIKKQPNIQLNDFDSNDFDSVLGAFSASLLPSMGEMGESVLESLKTAYFDGEKWWDDDFEQFNLLGFIQDSIVFA